MRPVHACTYLRKGYISRADKIAVGKSSVLYLASFVQCFCAPLDHSCDVKNVINQGESKGESQSESLDEGIFPNEEEF